MTGYSFRDKGVKTAPATFAQAATPGYSPTIGVQGDRVLLSEKIGRYSRVETLLLSMTMKGLEPSDLLPRAKALAAQNPDFKIPMGFRAAEIERWFSAGDKATAPRDLFECAWRVAETSQPKKGFELNVPANQWKFN
jgi:hypothetical protein